MANIFGLFAGDLYRILFGEVLRAEHALMEMLLSFAKSIFFMELTSTFDLYAAQTEDTARLDRIFKTIGQRPQQRPTELSTLLTQARKVIDDYKQQSPACDVALVVAAK